VEFGYKRGKIDEKCDALGIFYCRHRYSFLIFLFFLLSLLAIPFLFRLEIPLLRPKDMAYLPSFRAVDPICRWNLDR